MSEIERELVEATKVRKSSHKNRQDFLAAIVRGVDKLHQDEWDSLSDAAVNWHAAAVESMDKKRHINDFPDVALESSAQALETEGSDNAEPDRDAEMECDLQPIGSEETSGEKKEKAKAPKAKKVKEKVPDPDIDRYDTITGEKDRFGITIGTKTHDAVKMYNTKTGASLNEVDEKIHGRFYNILKKLEKDGHKLEQLEGRRYRLTHKDDLEKGWEDEQTE